MEDTLGSFPNERYVRHRQLGPRQYRIGLVNLGLLQTFHAPLSRRHEWFNRIWVLVPYDTRGLKRTLKNLSDESASKQTSKDDYPITVASESFFEKCFQIRFAVSPPIQADWKKFLLEKLKEAFPCNHEQDFHLIYQVLYQLRDTRQSPPTPRELIIFVNQIGAYHRIWQHLFR